MPVGWGGRAPRGALDGASLGLHLSHQRGRHGFESRATLGSQGIDRVSRHCTRHLAVPNGPKVGEWGVSWSRIIVSCGYGLRNDVPLLLLGLIPHIVRGIGILNVLIARLREPQETVGALTPLMVHRASWEHV